MKIGARLGRSVTPRVLFAMVLGVLALVIQNSPLRESTFLNSWNLALYDEVAAVRRNTVAGHAPPVIIVDFAGKARKEYFAAHPQTGDPSANGRDAPQSTPLALIQQTMVDARRMGARAVAIDIDLGAMLAQRDPKDVAAFSAFLKGWAADRTAPFTVFVRTALPLGEDEDGPPALGATPWDAVVAAAPNLAWGGSGGEATSDGVLRYQYMYTCPDDAFGRRQTMPSAAVFIAVASWQSQPGQVKSSVREGMARAGVCASAPPGAGFDIVADGRHLKSDSQRSLIDYHLSTPETAGPGARLPAGPWAPGAQSISLWEPGEVLDNLGPEVGAGSILILGSSQPLFPDVHWTPYKEKAGDVILANCIRGTALGGPIRDIGIPWQLLGLVMMLFTVHYFFSLMKILHEEMRRIRGPLGAIIGSATSLPAAKIYSLGLVYAASILVGSILLDHGYWQTTPFIGASIYILIGDAIEILEGGGLSGSEAKTDEH